jgi:hypothetical protein
MGCEDKQTTFTKKIQNDSTKECTFYFFGDNNPNLYGDTVIVAAGTSQTIYSYFEENSSTNAVQPCAIYTDNNDTISVEIVGGNKLTKSFFDNDDWDYNEVNYEQVCTFVITDSDIQ